VIGESVKRAPKLDVERIDEVVFGNANGAGEENRNIARMGTLLAGLPVSIPGTTVNRLCGSSLDAAIIASRQINAGDAELMLVGGAESMSRAPWVLPKTEKPYPAGDMTLASTTLGWRLVNKAMPKEWTISLGEATERLREKYGVTRQQQDEFAAASHNLSAAAWDEGFYDNLVAPVPGTDLVRDEGIRPGSSAEKLAGLKTVFRTENGGPEGGTVTAGNASPLSDGASAAWIGSENASSILGMEPLARIAGRGAHANDPQYFGYAPVEAANKALAKAGIGWDQVGAVELNEAFAAQSLACINAWGIDSSIVNRHGGAIAMGHPLGASGTRILGTLARSLHASGERWGVAAICIGVGQGLAVVLENVTASSGNSAGKG
jgi:acetyl-CoA acetyltransferase family protein